MLIPPPNRLALLFLLDGDFRAAWVRLEAAGQVAKTDGRAIEGPQALRAAAARRAEAMGAEMLRRLGALGAFA